MIADIAHLNHYRIDFPGLPTSMQEVESNLGFRSEAGFTNEGRVGVKGSIKF